MLSRVGSFIFSLPPTRYVTNRISQAMTYFYGKCYYLLNQAFGPKQTQKEDILITKALNRHMVIIDPAKKTPTEKTRAQLNELMELSGANARIHYCFFSEVINAEFFLGMNDKKGMELRKKILPFFSPNHFKTDFSCEAQKLLAQIAKRPYERHAIIPQHFLDLLMRNIVGLELTETMRKKLLQLDEQAGFISLAFTFLPHYIARRLPPIRNFIIEFENETKSFFREKIKKLRLKNESEIDKSSWFVVTISKKLPAKKLSDITDEEIEKLIMDADIRSSLGVVLGMRNISTAISILFNFLNPQNKKQHALVRLQKTLKKSPVVKEDWLKPDKIPLLHAYYLETILHATSKGFGIPRYTQEGIATENLHVPPRSLVVLLFSQALKKFSNKRFPADEFAPSRFLNKKQNGLKQIANLNQDVFTPFGMGSRMCPGNRIAEVIIKNYLIQFAYSIKTFKNGYLKIKRHKTTRDVKVVREKREIKALLINSIFRKPISNHSKNNKKINAKIANLIVEYTVDANGHGNKSLCL